MPVSLVTGPPFDQLLPFNGGIDQETQRTEINLAYDLTFFGTTVSGKRVQSDTASGLLIFQYNAGFQPGFGPSKGDSCAGQPSH